MFVCLFVFVCLHENSKSSKQIFLKMFMWEGQPMEEVTKFGKGLDHMLDRKNPEFSEYSVV